MVNSNKKEEIKQALDIVDVIGKTINLTMQSHGIYVGATSSLSKSGVSLKVDQGLQLWHDLSGRAEPKGGDVFSWIAYEYGLNIDTEFPKILSIAADLAGVQLEEITAEQAERIKKKQIIQDILTRAADVYHANLTPEIRAYINKKWGITDKTIDRLKIGYAKPGNGNPNLGKIADCDEWTESGLFTVFPVKEKKENGPEQLAYEVFRGRVVFPYWNGGKVVNFAARGDFKAPINTPDTKYEKNGEEIIKYKKLLTHNEKHLYVNECINNGYIWGEDSLKGNNFCVITEGIADAIILMQNEYPVLSPVTTKFAKHDIEKLLQVAKKLETVYICNDNEDSGAGEDGAIRTGILLRKEGINVKMMLLPRENLDKMDVAEYFLRHTKEEFEEVKEDSCDILVHLLNKVTLSTSTDPVKAKTENMKKAKEFVQKTLVILKDEEEAKLFIKNEIKAHFTKFTNDECKALLKVYQNAFSDESAKNPEQSVKLAFDLDSESGRSTMVQVLSRELMSKESIKFVAGFLRVYDKGVYPASPDALKKLQKEVILTALMEHKTPIMEKHANSVIKMLEIMTSVSQDECNLVEDEIAVNNGVLNLKTFELTEFSPAKVFFNKMPVDYLPNAPEPENFLKLMETAFKGNEEQYDLMQEVFGFCLLNNYKYQSIIYLLGDGGNGKGTVLKLLTYMLGNENTSSATINQLTDHNNVEYYLALLHGKKANICGDVGSKRIENTENIKKLSSNTDKISARLPYGVPFDFINNAKLIFAMNKMPKKDAFTTGDKRRDVIISFKNHISDSQDDIHGLSEIIRDSGEMPGVLNWAIEGLKRLERNQRFSDKRTVAEKGREYDMKSNPMKYFVDDCIEYDPKGGLLPNVKIYDAYSEYRKIHGMPELSEAEIKNGLKFWCNQIGIVTSERREYADKLMGFKDEEIKSFGKQPHVFTCIKLMNNNTQEPKESDSTPSKNPQNHKKSRRLQAAANERTIGEFLPGGSIDAESDWISVIEDEKHIFINKTTGEKRLSKVVTEEELVSFLEADGL